MSALVRAVTGSTPIFENGVQVILAGRFAVMALVAEVGAVRHQLEGALLAGMFLARFFVANGAFGCRHRTMNELGLTHDRMTLGRDARFLRQGQPRQNQKQEKESKKGFHPVHNHILPSNHKMDSAIPRQHLSLR